jgi:hypothetical protein
MEDDNESRDNDDSFDEDDSLHEEDSVDEDDSMDEDNCVDKDDIDKEMAQLNDDIRELDKKYLLVERQLIGAKKWTIDLVQILLFLNAAEEINIFCEE